MPIDGFIADFFCADAKLVVEVDGEHHFTGPEQRRHDEFRTRIFVGLGIRVIRFDARAVLKESDAVARTICRELMEPSGPLPGPPPDTCGGQYRERE